MKKIMIFVMLLLCLILSSSCNLKKKLISNLPVECPEDFSFEIHFSLEGYYDSKTQVLLNGYNYQLDQECKTLLEMDFDTLKEIYSKIRNIGFDRIPSEIKVSNLIISPNDSPYLELRYGDYIHRVLVDDAMMLEVNEWYCYRRLGRLIEDIKLNYIYNTDEFKNLPENQRRHC